MSAAVAEHFAAPHPGWPSARHHCPDVLIAAANARAVERGDFTLVLVASLWLAGGARPVRAESMEKAGTIDKEAFAKLPAVTGTPIRAATMDASYAITRVFVHCSELLAWKRTTSPSSTALYSHGLHPERRWSPPPRQGERDDDVLW